MTQNKVSTDTVEQFVARISQKYDIKNDKSLVAVISAEDVMNANMAPKAPSTEPRKEQNFKMN